MTEEIDIENIEFSKEPFLADEFLRELPEAMQSYYNGLIRGITKRTKLKFAQIRNLPYSKFNRLLERFTEELGLTEEYGFLGSRSSP